MEYLAVGALAALAAVVMWRYVRHHAPFWRLRMEQMRDGRPEERSWTVFPKTEYTVSRDGSTRRYSSLEEMPPEDRRRFEDGLRQIEEARRQFQKMPKEPVFGGRRPAPKTGAPGPRPKANRDLN